ncbi:MAG TPA: response regulator [Polyangiaceae bacterium]|jgi:two-component system chemotaxis response regulator CheY|nr:response regulator [Polyangiaceae bacterium]
MTTTVLIVDDAPTVRRYLSDIMEKTGYDVLSAPSGPHAMVTLRNNSVDLVLLDYNLPGMNGLSVLHWMRSDPVGLDMPVVMLTTETAPSLVQRAKALGAAGWLVKPPDPKELVWTAQNALSRRSPLGN